MCTLVQIFALVLALALTMASQAAIKSEAVEHKDGDAELRGFVYYKEEAKGNRPGVIVVHE